MTLVKINQRPMEKRFNALFEDLLQPLTSRVADEMFFPSSGVPVNIREAANAFILEVVAPGFEKSDFSIHLNENLLTISAEKKEGNAKESDRQIRREYSRKSFTRTFTMDETIQADKIMAKYENGLLLLELPKKEMVKVEPIAIQVK